MKHQFCRGLLAAARHTQRQLGVKLPRLWCWRSRGCGPNDWWEVRDGRTGTIVWQGAAHCAYHARSEAIRSELHKLGQGELL